VSLSEPSIDVSGQCCQLRAGDRQLLSDISVVRSC